MITIYRNTHDVVITTDCQDVDALIPQLTRALFDFLEVKDDAKYSKFETVEAIFGKTFQIVFKLAGYKADKVYERKYLICGQSIPQNDEILVEVKEG